MGFEEQPIKTLQISKNEEESLKICCAKNHEQADIIDSVSIEYFFHTILPRKPTDLEIDIGRISILQLSHCKLTNLPISCRDLNLKHLDLSHNKLTEVPACIYSGLKQLEVLNLSHNALSTFQIEPECVPHLKKLKLNHNAFKSLPKWVLMFKCINLEELDYSRNKADHYKYLKNSYNLNITKLRKLKLKNSHLIENDFGFLKCFKQLRYLDISNKYNVSTNQLQELDELFVKPRWRQLEVLKVNNLSLAFFPEGIAWLETLIELHINSNCISWLPDGIEFMVNLVVLDISFNNMVAIPEKLTKLEYLEVLKAACNYIGSLPDFTLMPALKVLDLYNNFLEEVSYSHQCVKSIDLEDNYLDTDDLKDPEYKAKRDEMRLGSINPSVRTNGPKLEEDKSTCSSRDSQRSWSDAYFDDEIIGDSATFNKALIVDEEDWDLPRKVTSRNPDIDTDDDEWRGSADVFFKRTEQVCEKVYVADEDWMFVDAEDFE